VFALFDDLILLSEGRVVYAGPAADAVAHFEGAGFPCPPRTNPAEFLADLVAVDHSSPDAEAATSARVAGLQAAWAAKAGTAGEGGAPARGGVRVGGAAHRPHVSVPAQLRLLATRAWRQATRDKATAVARAASNVSSAIIFGAIFWRMGAAQTSIQDRLGLLQVASINAAMSALVKTLNVFPKERVVVDRERAKGGYGVAPYFLSKLVAEAPLSALFPLLFGAAVYPATGLHPTPARFAKFLATITLESFSSTALGLAVGAAAPTADAALALGPAVMVVFIVFGGVYVNQANVPAVLRWVPRASLIKHAFEGLAVNEFAGLTFDPSPPPPGEGSETRIVSEKGPRLG
jgi:ABC-type multidrug transport system permease subunit